MDNISSRFNFLGWTRLYFRNLIRHGAPREIPITTPNCGISRCQPIGEPVEYSMIDVWIKLLGSILKTFPAHVRSGKRNGGISGAAVISLAPNSYCQPKLAVLRFPVN